jgi:ubiquinone/menaquinone biosynthesis C-methylase UbiE
MSIFSRLTHPRRVECAELETSEQIDAFIESRALEYSTRLEDDFVKRAMELGVDGGMVLDVGTRVGLVVLKILWQNENFYAIGMDSSKAMIERARETAVAWGLDQRVFFQVGDARRMRFKSSYFDLVISDSTLHCFDDPVSVLAEIGRVLKPRGALLIRDLERPSRLNIARRIEKHGGAYGKQMKHHVETAIRASYNQSELQDLVRASGVERVQVVRMDEHHLAIQRTGESDPNSWIRAREQYL